MQTSDTNTEGRRPCGRKHYHAASKHQQEEPTRRWLGGGYLDAVEKRALIKDLLEELFNAQDIISHESHTSVFHSSDESL